MQIKYTKSFLTKLEEVFTESDFDLRYEKGNFKAGFCVLNEQKIVVVNKYYSLEGKVNCLVDILREISLDTSKMTPKNRSNYLEIRQTEIKSS